MFGTTAYLQATDTLDLEALGEDPSYNDEDIASFRAGLCCPEVIHLRIIVHLNVCLLRSMHFSLA